MSSSTFSSQYHGQLAEMMLSENQKVLFHSEFKSGVNLRVGDNLIYISYPYFQLPPFGIMLKQTDMNRLKPLFKSSSLLLDCGTLYIGNQKITLDHSVRVKTTIDNKLIKPSNFDELFSPYKSNIYGNVHGYKNNMSALVFDFIGKGQGLTPSGDDFLVGLLALNSRVNFLVDSVFVTIKKCIDDRRTTDVSMAYLNAALKGQFSTSIVKVIRSLDNTIELSLALEELSKTGHSSGNDTISGIYYGLQNLIK